MTKDIQISARIPESLSAAVEKIAALQGRSRSWIIEKALERYVETEADFIAAVQEGLADSKAGRVYGFEEAAAAFEACLTPARKPARGAPRKPSAKPPRKSARKK